MSSPYDSAEFWQEGIDMLAPLLPLFHRMPIPLDVNPEVCSACHDVECCGACDQALWITHNVIEFLASTGDVEQLRDMLIPLETAWVDSMHEPGS